MKLPPAKESADFSYILLFEDDPKLGVDGRRTETLDRTELTIEDMDTGVTCEMALVGKQACGWLKNVGGGLILDKQSPL